MFQMLTEPKLTKYSSDPPLPWQKNSPSFKESGVCPSLCGAVILPCLFLPPEGSLGKEADRPDFLQRCWKQQTRCVPPFLPLSSRTKTKLTPPHSYVYHTQRASSTTAVDSEGKRQVAWRSRTAILQLNALRSRRWRLLWRGWESESPRDLSAEQGVQMDSRGPHGGRLLPLHNHPTPPSLSLLFFLSSSNNIIHSHQLQNVSKLRSRGKCQWPSDGWKRSGVQMGSRRMHACVCVCAHMCIQATRRECWIFFFFFECESHQREIITHANLILTK